MADAPTYVFHMERTTRDLEGYYVTRWDRALSVEVEASTEEAAYQALWAMSGRAPSGRCWTGRIAKVTVPHPTPTPEETR